MSHNKKHGIPRAFKKILRTQLTLLNSERLPDGREPSRTGWVFDTIGNKWKIIGSKGRGRGACFSWR